MLFRRSSEKWHPFICNPSVRAGRGMKSPISFLVVLVSAGIEKKHTRTRRLLFILRVNILSENHRESFCGAPLPATTGKKIKRSYFVHA